jgi:cell division protein FtsW
VVACYAVVLSDRQALEKWPGETWLKLAGIAATAAVLPLFQRDFGSAALLCVIGFTMVWLAGGKGRYLLLVAAAGIALVTVAIAMEPYRLRRITLYLSHLTGGAGGYQTRQSLIALGAGGLFGVGIGESIQKLFYLPSSHADFIYAIICEEMGFLFGGLPVIMLYVFMLREGTGIARTVNGRLPYLLASGMTFLVFMQAMWHIAVVLVLVPTKGLALPFVSYGGSCLIASMMSVGVVLRCAAEPATAAARTHAAAREATAWTSSS